MPTAMLDQTETVIDGVALRERSERAPLRPGFARDLPLRRISADEYHRLIDAGILNERHPVELLNGWLFVKLDHYEWTPEELAEIRRIDDLPSEALTSTSPPLYPLWRFTVADYHDMIEHEIFDENDNIELLRGWLVSKMTHSPLHDDTIEDLGELLRRWLPAGWRLRTQSAITTHDSEPEPDLAIVRSVRPARGQRHPGSDSIGLLIEVADSSLKQDRTEKLAVYAAARIVEYWIVNIRQKQLEVFSVPSGDAAHPSYGKAEILLPNQSVTLRLDGQALATLSVAEILSRALVIDGTVSEHD